MKNLYFLILKVSLLKETIAISYKMRKLHKCTSRHQNQLKVNKKSNLKRFLFFRNMWIKWKMYNKVNLMAL